MRITNKITDKIIAYPTKNLAVWSMRNLGSVEIKGIDVTGSVSLQPCEKLRINLSGNYTYQQALDVTNPDPASEEGRTYKHQIAYTPRVSGSGQVGIETSWVNLSYSFLFSGKRIHKEKISQRIEWRVIVTTVSLWGRELTIGRLILLFI